MGSSDRASQPGSRDHLSFGIAGADSSYRPTGDREDRERAKKGGILAEKNK